MKENLIGSRNRDELIMRFVAYICQRNDYVVSIWGVISYGHSVGLNYSQRAELAVRLTSKVPERGGLTIFNISELCVGVQYSAPHVSPIWTNWLLQAFFVMDQALANKWSCFMIVP